MKSRVEIGAELDKFLPVMIAHVTEFREAFDLPIGTHLDVYDNDLHEALLSEEWTELATAASLVEQADALVDMAYIITGRIVHSKRGLIHDRYLLLHILTIADRLRIDFKSCWNEVHRSNMSKLVVDYADYEATCRNYDVQDTSIKPVRDTYPTPVVVVESTVYPVGKTLKADSYSPAELADIVLLKE